ncbi:type II secretion system ATPase GspE [Parasphingorhabdus litoris]|uniref:Type II secretion system ATPase GspE n=1 Tax=Parasphingorhabdus litoris TaxID=394733 RepID=A0ABN0ZZN0_9SPHN|nr:GspE/PulE family protein [Parasphingorhabdus litoris]
MSSLVDHLTHSELIALPELERSFQIAEETGMRLPWVLSQMGLVSDEILLAAMHETSGCEIASDDLLQREPAMIDGLNPLFLKKHKIIPIKDSDGSLDALIGDAEDVDAIAALSFAAGRAVQPKLARLGDIEDRLNTYLNLIDQDDLAVPLDADLDEELERLRDGISEAPVIRQVHEILTNAVKRKASDVHLEPMARHLSVRYRIDGRLSEVERHPTALAEPIASRIKVMAGLDISESRLPQDGRIKLTVRGEEVDVRVSTSPIANGESIVMRLLGRASLPLELNALGLPPSALQKLNAALEKPHGIILLTGPTGSGKTTTLYAAMNALRAPEVKILTVEDPVEVMLDGINQVQVHPEIGLSYASSLRAFLRQDPDIIMIGEIRDGETAEIAHRAALTGHLVLSTLHTNSALGAYTRLNDIGVEPFLVASTVIATIAQRLVRSLCDDCKKPATLEPREIALFDQHAVPAPQKLFEANGCGNCHHTGYAGRRPLIEIVEVDEALRSAIRNGNAESHQLNPSETLLGHGLSLAGQGVTSLDEVQRVVSFT